MAVHLRSLLKDSFRELRIQSTSKWVRAFVDRNAVVDTKAALVVWEPRRITPLYAVPVSDIAGVLVPASRAGAKDDGRPVLDPSVPFSVHTTPGVAYSIEVAGKVLADAAFVPEDSDLAGYAVLDWEAFDQWREEDEEVVGHPHDPFARIDCLRSTRQIVVTLGDVTLADSKAPTLLFETGLPVRYYFPQGDVRMNLLEPSDQTSVCCYKGTANYLSANIEGKVTANIAWVYRDPLLDGEPVRDMICFWPHLVDMTRRRRDPRSSEELDGLTSSTVHPNLDHGDTLSHNRILG